MARKAWVPAHDQTVTIRLVEHIPPHGPRGVAFRRAKRRMKKLGLTNCVVTGCTTGAPIEYHHDKAEHAWQNGVSIRKLNKLYGLHLTRDEFADWVQSPGNLEPLCLHPDSLVTMADGSVVPICHVHAGDAVLGADGATHRVSARLRRPHEGVLVRPGIGPWLTPEHRVLTPSGFREVRSLKIGVDRVRVFGEDVGAGDDGRRLSSRGRWDTLLHRRSRFYRGPVHDLAIEGVHSFIADGVVVHNCAIHHRFSVGVHALPEPMWRLVRVWTDSLPPPAEHITKGHP